MPAFMEDDYPPPPPPPPTLSAPRQSGRNPTYPLIPVKSLANWKPDPAQVERTLKPWRDERTRSHESGSPGGNS